VQGKPFGKQSQLAIAVWGAGETGTAVNAGPAAGIATTSSVRALVAAALRVSGACAARRYTRTTANAAAAADANAYGWATAENVAFAVVARISTAAAINAVAATAVVIAGGAEVAIRAARTAGGVAF
jgi:hypothetical protein